MALYTWTFAGFFIAVFAVHLALRRTALGVGWLLIASLVFYAWWQPANEPWSPLYLGLILYCSVVDYVAALLMGRVRRRKTLLVLAVLNHLVVLGYFKYTAFFAGNLNGVLGSLGVGAVSLPKPAQPLGISFYTFVAIAYVVDVYRARLEAERNPVRLAAFITFFPKVVMGPIERAGNLLPQLRARAPLALQNVADGLSLFVVGFFKKRALADFLALYVNKVYGEPGAHNAPDLLLATFFFTWQIYFDFSGYTDMARGLARMMGYDLALNFNKPYLASSLSEFWGRWHISLSQWFRDYVYIPLGGNRCSRWRMYMNLMATMLVSGLWHGAGWAWIVWGFVHGLGLIANKALESVRGYQRSPKLLRQALVFVFVFFTWILFRAGTPGNAAVVISRIFTTPWTMHSAPLVGLVLCLLVWAHQALSESRLRTLLELRPVRAGLALAMLGYLVFGAASGVKQFIYELM